MELIPVQVAIDSSSPPYLWAVMMDPTINGPTLSRSLWKRPLFGEGKWTRIRCPLIEELSEQDASPATMRLGAGLVAVQEHGT